MRGNGRCRTGSDSGRNRRDRGEALFALAPDEKSSVRCANFLASVDRSHYRGNCNCALATMIAEAATQSPDDLEAMRPTLVALAEEKGAEEVISILLELLAHARADNTQLKQRLEKALRQLYGRKSEKVNTAQLSLLLQGLGEQAPETAQTAAAEIPSEGDHPGHRSDVLRPLREAVPQGRLLARHRVQARAPPVVREGGERLT